jgi:hypothetical protein
MQTVQRLVEEAPDAYENLGIYGTDVPFAGHALERLEVPVAEAQSGANHQVFHGTGH